MCPEAVRTDGMMRSKYEPRSTAIRLFLSSSMSARIDRELRRAVKAFLDRFELYECQIIETVSSSSCIDDECRRQVDNADIIIMILEKELRPGVKDEFYYAQNQGKEVLSFYRPDGAPSDLELFVRDEVRNPRTGLVCPDFANYEQLLDLLEENLLKHLLESYRASLTRAAMSKQEEKGIRRGPNGQPGPEVLSSEGRSLAYHDQL
jgi:hypothetical protein